MRRTFAHVHVSGPGAQGLHLGTSWAASTAPVIAYINHSAWWDAVVPFVLARQLFRRESWAIMEGAQIGRYPIFRRIGCFGATSASLDDARRTVVHAVTRLRGGPRRMLWLCPQGALLAPRAPLVFRSGLARIARLVPEAMLLPIGLRYEFRTTQRPECFMRIGAPIPRDGEISVRTLTQRLRDALAAELDLLDGSLLEHPTEPPGGAITLH